MPVIETEMALYMFGQYSWRMGDETRERYLHGDGGGSCGGRKGDIVEDLEKAIFYRRREIEERLKEGQEGGNGQIVRRRPYQRGQHSYPWRIDKARAKMARFSRVFWGRKIK